MRACGEKGERKTREMREMEGLEREWREGEGVEGLCGGTEWWKRPWLDGLKRWIVRYRHKW